MTALESLAIAIHEFQKDVPVMSARAIEGGPSIGRDAVESRDGKEVGFGFFVVPLHLFDPMKAKLESLMGREPDVAQHMDIDLQPEPK